MYGFWFDKTCKNFHQRHEYVTGKKGNHYDVQSVSVGTSVKSEEGKEFR